MSGSLRKSLFIKNSNQQYYDILQQLQTGAYKRDQRKQSHLSSKSIIELSRQENSTIEIVIKAPKKKHLFEIKEPSLVCVPRGNYYQ